jgi:FAD:protein FMN transferase
MPSQFEALGTKWWITIFDNISKEQFEGAVGALKYLAETFENNYSRFKSDSLISQLNDQRSLQTPSAELYALLTYGKSLYLRTNTHFNFLTGHLQEARGYDANYSFTAEATALNAQPGNPITDLQVTPDTITLQSGNLDLGGFGKGYLIDLMVDELRGRQNLNYFIINGGGDLYATSEHGEPVEIYMEHPTKPRHFIHRTTIHNQAFASSSPYQRVWDGTGGTFSHIVSAGETPRTASFVKAETARDADAFATSALLASEQELEQFAKTESLDIARFSPATNQLWKTVNFDTKNL